MANLKKKSKLDKKTTESDTTVRMTELILPQHTNALGTVFGGTVVGWIDIAAAIAAQRHSGMICVTASIDELHFLKPMRKGMVVNIFARVSAVHRTSCEVLVEVQGEDPRTREHFHTARAFLTFVALDEKGRPTAIPPLPSVTREDRQLAVAGKKRKEHREKMRKELQEVLAQIT